MFRAPALLVVILVGASCAAGCSNLVDVRGEVTLDGQPLPDAQVMFVPAGGRPATGKTDAQGKFRLTTNSAGDGLAPGSYTVTVTANKVEYQQQPGSESGYVEKLIWLAPERYSRPAEANLTREVTPATKDIKLELKSTP